MGVPGRMSVSEVQRACMWYGVYPMAVVSPGGGASILQLCEPRVPIPVLMTGSLPRCEGQRVRAGVQLWPQGGVESPTSQQYYPGWAQLFLETGGGGVPKSAGDCWLRPALSVPAKRGPPDHPPNLELPSLKMGVCILFPNIGSLPRNEGL